ncbi:hypothetical protein ACFV99_01205 [Streptomyces sp. NPDC059944]|uniref:hypothetical protein n=1 Tax=unclassified Streptomyces TaxID=2593676 RepID=UPI0036520137
MATAVVVAHGREVGEAEAAARTGGRATPFDRYLDTALGGGLADEGTQPGGLRLGQEAELPVAPEVHRMTTFSAPNIPIKTATSRRYGSSPRPDPLIFPLYTRR